MSNMTVNAKITMDNGYEEFKEALNRPRKNQSPRQVRYTCEQICGRTTPCGNRHCSNYRGTKKR